jgi:hypothetical protein
MLEELASEETIVSHNKRWVASIPFGVGQFQNRDYVLGTVFLTAETLLLATAITSTALQLHYNSQANGGAGFTRDTPVDALNRNLETAQIVTLSATGALILVAAGGIVEAHLAFVPEFRDGTRPRRLPSLNQSMSTLHGLSIEPSLAPTRGGALFGVGGRF